MCGIVGLVGSSNFFIPLLRAMIEQEKHRGPDGEGVWLSKDKRIALGHRKLAVIDLTERGGQPMADISGRYVITFNGAIYYYIEIYNELKDLGAVFRSGSDTEVILDLYH